MTTKTVSDSNSTPIESVDQLYASFARGEKPRDRWRIGTEHEKFVYALADHHAPSYDEPGGIRDLLAELEQFGWAPVYEGPEGSRNVIALTGADTCHGKFRTKLAAPQQRPAVGRRQRSKLEKHWPVLSCLACASPRHR